MTLPEVGSRQRLLALWPILVGGLALLGACAPSAPRVAAPAALPAEERPFFLSPLEGYPMVPAPATAQQLEAGFRRVVAGEPEAALAVARSLREVDPELAPARVLEGQALLVLRRPAEALEVATPAVERHPGYVAAQLLVGRAAEAQGDLVGAFEHYRGAANLSAAAEARAEQLRARALEILARRSRDALDRGRVAEAEAAIDRLERWAPEERVTLEAVMEVARVRGDRRRELGALRQLTGTPSERALLERRADLELEVGDPAAGLEIFEWLQERHPEDPVLEDKVAGAKFRWRLQVQPQEVQEVARRAELTRADFAVLLYWLVPGVRAGAPQAARIATDVLEHPHRQEIIRVVNLHLMDVDPTLRRFEPDRPLSRLAALRALLRVLARNERPPSCLAALEGNPEPSRALVCASAALCGLTREELECLPEARVSGAEALEWIRRTVAP